LKGTWINTYPLPPDASRFAIAFDQIAQDNQEYASPRLSHSPRALCRALPSLQFKAKAKTD
jgi:hypothetical protein